MCHHDPLNCDCHEYPQRSGLGLPHKPIKRIRNRMTEERCIRDGQFWPCAAAMVGAPQPERDGNVQLTLGL